MEKGKNSPCWCLLILAVLIVVWTWWWTPDWANWAITVAAVLVGLSTLSGKCCRKESLCCKDDDPADATNLRKTTAGEEAMAGEEKEEVAPEAPKTVETPEQE